MMKQVQKYALMSALATGLYVVLIAIFMDVLESYFSNTPDTILAPIFMLLLLIFSAAFTGSLVFARPVLWYLDDKKKDAISLLYWTIGFLFILVVLVAALLFAMI
ncbi:MAG TPA: hypothetical protein V6C58_00855 [Allocoleopsis sp.]